MRARVAVLVASLAAAPVSWPAAADGLPQLRTSPTKEPGPTVPDLTSRTPGVAAARGVGHLQRRRHHPPAHGPEGRHARSRGAGDALPLGAHARRRRVEDDDDGAVGVARHRSRRRRGRRPFRARCPSRGSRSATRDRRRGSSTPRAACSSCCRRAPAAPRHAGRRTRCPTALEAVRSAAAAVQGEPGVVPAAAANRRQPRRRPTRARASGSSICCRRAAGRAARRAALARDMGSPQGGVRGLERFVHDTRRHARPKS